jgi:hypothetical protein
MLFFMLPFLIAGQMLDSANCRTIGCWPYGRPLKGGAKAFPPYCPVSESVLYVAAGRSIIVLDVSNPSHVTQIDSLARPGGQNGWFSAYGDYCLTGQSKSGVAMYDIHDRRHPTLVSVYHLPWFANDGKLTGNYGFVVGDELRILDYADPRNPVEVGSCAIPAMTDAVFIKGDYAYLASNYHGLVVIDIHDLTNPHVVFHDTTYGHAARDIQVVDTLAYIAWEDRGLRILNVKDPTAPFEIGTFPGQIHSVNVVDTVAYVGRTRNNSYDTLYALSVADPAQPRILGRYRGCSPAFLGNRCYLLNPWSDTPMLDDTLFVIDISDPQSPALLGIYSQFHAATDDIFVSGNHVYAGTRGQGLKIYDVSDPSAPRLLSRLGSWHVGQACVSSNGVAYLACSPGPALATVDVTDPANPVLLGSLDTTVGGGLVTVQDTLAFLSSGHDVWVVDVAKPTSPRRIGVIPGGNNDMPGHCGVAGHLLFLTYPFGNTYLKIYDVWNPAQPESLCFYDIQVPAQDVAVRFPYAYVVGSQFIAMDISNPSRPHELARLDVDGYCQSVALDGNTAYVAESYSGVYAYDVSNPAAPVETGYYVTPMFAEQVQVSNGLVYDADYDGWVVLQPYESGIAEENGRAATAPSGILVRYLPSSAILKIRLPRSNERVERLEIYNAAGRLVYALGGETLSGKSEIDIDHVELRAGVNFLVVQTAHARQIAKLVVAR